MGFTLMGGDTQGCFRFAYLDDMQIAG